MEFPKGSIVHNTQARYRSLEHIYAWIKSSFNVNFYRDRIAEKNVRG